MCLLCPQLPVTGQSLVRHVQTVHKTMGLAEINRGFAGLRRFVQCPQCPIRCLAPGVQKHINSRHPAQGAPVRQAALPQVPLHFVAPPVQQPAPPVVDLQQEVVHQVQEGPQEEELPEALPAPGLQEPLEEPLPQPHQLDQNIAEYSTLVGHFHRGAYFCHHTWKPLLKSIVLTLLRDCVKDDEESATRGIAALQLLPGMVEYIRCFRRQKVWTPIGFLRDIEAAADKAEAIIRIARDWVPHMRVQPTVWPQPNVEHLRARVESLVSENRLSAATTTLGHLEDLLKGVQQPAPASAEFMAERIAALHPVADERDLLPPSEDDPPMENCFQLTPDQVRARFYLLQNKNTAAGNTGWSSIWLRAVGDDRSDPLYVHQVTPPSPLHVAFTAFFNKILQGRIEGEGRELLVTARLIMIPKPQGGLRPIRIECAIMRFMSATAAALARVVVSPLLRPIQLGGGLKCGVEFGARLLDAAYAREDAVISIDIANAFNTARHRAIWDGLAEKFPGILRYYRMKHEHPAKMIGNDGKTVAWTRTGVGQGDPWGGLFFEVGMHPALLQLAQEVRNVEASLNRQRPHNPVLRPGSVSAYEDDTQVRGELDVIFRVAPRIEGIFAQHGFAVSVPKSKITGPEVENYLDRAPDDFAIDSEGLIALGVPVGSAHFRRSTTETKVKSMEPPAEALKLLRPRTALQLLLSCISPRPSFLFRTAPDPTVTHKAAREFDASMVSAVAAVFKLEVTPGLAERVHLPLRMGGFGLTRHHGMASEKNQILSRTFYTAFLAEYYPSELQTTQQQYELSEVRLGSVEDKKEATEITDLVMATITDKNCYQILAEGMKKAQKQTYKDIHTAAITAGLFSKAAWILSAATSTTAYLMSTIGLDNDGYFGVAEFRCAGRNTLGYGPRITAPGELHTCTCRHVYDPLLEPFHGMSCAHNKGFRNRRHNDIRDLLYKLIKRRYPTLTPAQLELETIVGQAPDREGALREVKGDVIWWSEGEKLIIDIMCIDVGCKTYLEPPVSSYQSAERAAVHAEDVKRRNYARVTVPAPIRPACVLPFIVEASGRLGPVALSVINRICGTQTYMKSNFLKELSMITAKFTGLMLKVTQDQ